MANDTLEMMIMPSVNKLTKSFEREYIRNVEKYIDYNTDVLSCNIPLYRLLFSDKRRTEMINMTGINHTVLKNARNIIDKDKAVTKPIMYELINTPFNLLTSQLIRRYYLEKNTKMINALVMNLAMSFYSMIHPKYYRYLPNPDIMEFTISRVTTKFTFKIYKTLLESIKHIAFTNHNSMIDELVNNGDTGALFYLVSLNSRLNNVMKSFCSEYMKDFEEKNAIFTQQDSSDPDNFVQTTNMSGLIMSKTSSATTDFFTTRVDKKMVALSAKQVGINANLLEQSVGLIKERKSNEIENVIRNIIVTYLNEPGTSEKELGSTKFVLMSMKVYSKSNVTNKSIMEIKDSLDKLLEATSTMYKRCEREATRINYRKGLYFYIILSIQQSVK